MRTILTLLLCCFILPRSSGQTQRKISAYLLTQYNHSLYDYTISNNPWGIGVGLQTFVNTKSRLKPTLEFTGDLYLEDDKVLKLNPDGSIPEQDNTVGSMINLFAGSLFHPSQNTYISLVAGPSFIGGQTRFGIKPSLGFYFSQTQRWTGKVSYINVFNRFTVAKESFGSLSVAIGLKLF